MNTATGEVHELREPDDAEKRRTYSFGGRHGQISFERVMAILSKDSGLTGDDIRVFFYCGIKTYEKGGATAVEAAEYLGLTPQATRRIAKKLAEHKMLLVAEVIGRTIRYKASVHIISSLTGAEQSEEAVTQHLPTLPGRPGATPKDSSHATPQPVSRTRSGAGTDRRTAASEAERADDVRDPGRPGRQRRVHGGAAG
ncbi:MarR family transcriptional regulator [Streptomyces sp. NPDC054834]